jgi:hypothetical protein
MENKSHMHIMGQLYECSHCNQTGTCTVEEGGNSCYHCVNDKPLIKENRIYRHD